MKAVFIYFISLAALFSCNSNEHGSIDLDIPPSKKIYFDRLVELRGIIGSLDTLENGFDSLEIRLWYEGNIDHDRQIVVIKKTKVWEAELHTTSWNYGVDSARLTKRTVQKGFPIAGWKIFIDSLLSLDIMTMPDESLVMKREVANSKTILVEVATKYNYRFYSYISPVSFKEKNAYAAKMEKIMQWIEDQLGFKRTVII